PHINNTSEVTAVTDYKICATPRCPTIVQAGTPHCAKHRRTQEQRRGTATQRGYGHAHQRLRAKWEPIVEAGNVHCWRCKQRIEPSDNWHLGHDDNNREAYRVPEHATCNTSAAGKKSHSNKIPGET